MWLHLQREDCSTRQSVYNIYSIGRVPSWGPVACSWTRASVTQSWSSVMAVSGKTVVDANRIFHIKGQPLRALSREDSWKYLGIEFSPEGRRPIRLNNQLTRRWSGVRVLDLAKTAGGTSLWQIMRHVSRGFCEWAIFFEIQAILYLKWTIFDKNGVSFFSNSVLNISLI